MWKPAPRRALTALGIVLAIGGPVRGADVEREARELEARLIAPCCFSQQVSIHHSAAAEEVRQDIRRRLTGGETEDQVLQAYVARYGKRILAEPPAEGFDTLLHSLPPLGLVLTAALIVAIVRRFTIRGSSEAPPAAESASAAIEKRYGDELDEQLRDLD
jgi:cytochrome c-type biogenesis protein CcmH